MRWPEVGGHLAHHSVGIALYRSGAPLPAPSLAAQKTRLEQNCFVNCGSTYKNLMLG
jgi:hypothetical protein